MIFDNDESKEDWDNEKEEWPKDSMYVKSVLVQIKLNLIKWRRLNQTYNT